MDFSQFAVLIQGIKTGSDLVSAAVTVRDEAKLADASRQLKEVISRAYDALIQLQAQQLASAEKLSTNVQETSALREEVAELRRRAAEVERYSLAELAPGTMALRIKPECQGSEPLHYVCQPCMSKGIKAVLCRFERFRSPAWRCPDCNNEYPPRNIAGGGTVPIRRG